jgi:hypothetical protein
MPRSKGEKGSWVSSDSSGNYQKQLLSRKEIGFEQTENYIAFYNKLISTYLQNCNPSYSQTEVLP